MQKLAYLFLIYDSINHEELWSQYFREADSMQYNIYIHYKSQVPLKHFEKYKLPKCVPTKYADISIVLAQNMLLEQALKDAENTHFIFLSNSCIPVKSFSYVSNYLEKEFSYFNLSPEKHIAEHNRGITLGQYFSNVKKASQWCILNRTAAELLVKNLSEQELKRYFKNDNAIPDEYMYITYLMNSSEAKKLKLFNYESTNCPTFEFWNDKKYMFNNSFTSSHPENWDRRLKTYHSISKQELAFLKAAPCLFARKFSAECDLYDF